MPRFPHWIVFAGLTLMLITLMGTGVWAYAVLTSRSLHCSPDDVRLQCQIGLVESQANQARERRTTGYVDSLVVNAPIPLTLTAASLPATGFAPQTRLGFTVGDQWEPAIAADDFGHVYVLYPQYEGVPGCPTCPSPTMILLVSADSGATWGTPRKITAPGTGQWDAQIEVDPVDGKTVYAAWLQGARGALALAKSVDFGETWTLTAPPTHAKVAIDKPILAVRGEEVYVAYDIYHQLWVAVSHDGGDTFVSVRIDKGKAGLALAGGGTVTPTGDVYFAWVGYLAGRATAPANLYLTKSSDGGLTWTTLPLDVSAPAPDCPPSYGCGWAYLGAQAIVSSDDGGNIYALWNAGQTNRGPQRIYFARSTDGGLTWSNKQDVSTASNGVDHAFPAMVGGEAGDVRIAWMDTRAGDVWNTYYRSSTDGGETWSTEVDLSTYVEGYSYIQPGGFNFPFGDYLEMTIDAQGLTQAVWGEGLTYVSPGAIWYVRGE